MHTVFVVLTYETCLYCYILLLANVSALKERLISNVLCWQICSLHSCTVHLFDRRTPVAHDV